MLYIQLASQYIMQCAQKKLPQCEYERFLLVLEHGRIGITSLVHTAYVLEMLTEQYFPPLAVEVRRYFHYMEFMTRLQLVNRQDHDVCPPNLPDPLPPRTHHLPRPPHPAPAGHPGHSQRHEQCLPAPPAGSHAHLRTAPLPAAQTRWSHCAMSSPNFRFSPTHYSHLATRES